MDIKTVIFTLISYANLCLCLKITAHTTAGCSDTVNWIQNQLKPVYEEFSQYLQIEYVPWGRTLRNQDGSLTCQFGEQDCWANRVHRCALSLIDSQDTRVQYMECEFLNNNERPAYQFGSYLCAVESGVNILDLDYCVNYIPGEELAASAQVAAAVPMEVINFVPAVVFDDVPDASLLNTYFLQLRNLVCERLVGDPTVPITSC